MSIIDPRLEKIKEFPRAMKSYVMVLYEFVYELRPENILEIGVQRGQSTKAILMALAAQEYGKLTSIDHKNRIDILEDLLDLKPYWNFIKGDSHDKETQKRVINKYDMFFIDGDHSYEGIKKDWKMYEPMVKEGGIILLHDITNKNEGVKYFWKEIKYEKFAIDWGRAANGVIPGLGIVKKNIFPEK